MKKLAKRTVFLIFALLSCVVIESLTIQDEPEAIPINPNNPEVIPPRSIMPECYYQNGYVYVIGDNNVTSISGTVTRLSDNAQWSNSSSSNTLQIAVPTNPATYRLTFTMSDGSSYYGDYTLY